MNTLFTGLFTLECFLKLHAYGSRVRGAERVQASYSPSAIQLIFCLPPQIQNYTVVSKGQCQPGIFQRALELRCKDDFRPVQQSSLLDGGWGSLVGSPGGFTPSRGLRQNWQLCCPPSTFLNKEKFLQYINNFFTFEISLNCSKTGQHYYKNSMKHEAQKKKDKYRRKGKGHRSCLGDRVYIQLMAELAIFLFKMILKNRMNSSFSSNNSGAFHPIL